MPIFEKAVKAVNKLSQKDVTELKSFKSVSPSVALVSKVLCIMFENTPKVPKGTKREDELNIYWAHSTKNILKPDLLNKLKSYNKEDQNL